MSFINDVNGTKIIRRYNPFLLTIAILGILAVGTLVLFCVMPVMTLTYTEAGVETSVDVNAFTFIQAFYNRINTNAHTELGDTFLTFIRDQRGTTFNQIQSFMINGFGGKAEQIFMITFALMICLLAVFAAIEVLICLIALFFGRLHMPSIIKIFSASYVTVLGLSLVLLFVFNWLYGDIVNAVVANGENEVTKGSLSPAYLSIAWFAIAFVLDITIGTIYKSQLKNRVFVKNVKLNQ